MSMDGRTDGWTGGRTDEPKTIVSFDLRQRTKRRCHKYLQAHKRFIMQGHLKGYERKTIDNSLKTRRKVICLLILDGTGIKKKQCNHMFLPKQAHLMALDLNSKLVAEA